MKRIAIPITEGKLSEYFGQCKHYKIFEIDRMEVISKLIKAPAEMDIGLMPSWISHQGVTDVVTYKIDGGIMHLFAKYKINLYVGIKCKSPEEIVQNYLNGKLKSDEKIISEINKTKKL